MGVQVKPVDKRWNNLRHTYQLILGPASVVRLVDEPTDIPDIHYDFVPLRDISKHTNESFIGKNKLFLFCLIFIFSIKMLLVLLIHVLVLFHLLIEHQIKIQNVVN